MGLLLLVGCGRERAPGGTGEFGAVAGGGGLLRLAGTPYEMGWWHGHLLKTRVAARVDAAARLQPADYIETFADQALHRLSERMRQELDGIAAGAGVLPLDLMKAEVADEVLRFKGTDAGLLGIAGLVPHGPSPGTRGLTLRMRYGGPRAEAFARQAIVIHRKPARGLESVALGVPGSLGAWACVNAAGHGYVLAEVEIAQKRRLGFGGGRPFPLGAREALDASKDVEQFAAELTGTMGHIGIGFAYRPDDLRAVRAMAGVQVYGAPDLPWALDEQPFLAVGPFGDPASPDAKALQAQAVEAPTLTPDERWLALWAHGPAGASEDGPRVEFIGTSTGVLLQWSPREGRPGVAFPVTLR